LSWRSNKYQLYCLWLDPAGAGSKHINHYTTDAMLALPREQLFSYMVERASYIYRSMGPDVHFLQDQHSVDWSWLPESTFHR
jgi:hypothetical protein